MAYGLQSLIDGRRPTFPKFIFDQEGKLMNNPNFVKHQKQDCLLCACHLSSSVQTSYLRLFVVNHLMKSGLELNRTSVLNHLQGSYFTRGKYKA